MSDFIEELKDRGLIAQLTHEPEFKRHLDSGKVWGYCGFDPTADSLHVGNLLPLMMLSRWQRAGFHPIIVMGGGTALVGDPSGKTEMRQVLTVESIARNIEKIKIQVSGLLDLSPSKGQVLNNADWLVPIKYLDFLREIGSKFSVNRMLTAECFKARLEKGLSFIEFNYMLLQAYDFLYLYRSYQCTVQMGGDDQWSNILAGSDLIRRFEPESQSFCLTNPLLTTSDGRKMGKTERGAVWLDAEKTSPYEYFQYWRNVPDDMVGKCFRFFTFLPMSEVRRIDALQGAESNAAKEQLAYEATKILHGKEQAEAALETALQLFGKSGAGTGNEPEFLITRDFLSTPQPLVDLLVAVGAFPSKGEVKRLIAQGGLTFNGDIVKDINMLISRDQISKEEGCVIKKGKKHYFRLRISP